MGDNNGRVTAGLPSMTPGLRSAITKARVDREMSRQRLLDHVARETVTTAKDGAFDVTSPGQQLGMPLSTEEMMRRLKLCNPMFHFEVAIRDSAKMGIYVLENRDATLEKRFICGMVNGIMPERSIRVPKEKKVPDANGEGYWQKINSIDYEIRGWRTVLVMLLHSKLITQPQIDRFWPASDGNSQNWQKYTN